MAFRGGWLARRVEAEGSGWTGYWWRGGGTERELRWSEPSSVRNSMSPFSPFPSLMSPVAEVEREEGRDPRGKGGWVRTAGWAAAFLSWMMEEICSCNPLRVLAICWFLSLACMMRALCAARCSRCPVCMAVTAIRLAGERSRAGAPIPITLIPARDIVAPPWFGPFWPSTMLGAFLVGSSLWFGTIRGGGSSHWFGTIRGSCTSRWFGTIRDGEGLGTAEEDDAPPGCTPSWSSGPSGIGI